MEISGPGSAELLERLCDNKVARGVSQYSAADIRRIARRHSRDIEAALGYNYGENIIHRDDLVLP